MSEAGVGEAALLLAGARVKSTTHVILAPDADAARADAPAALLRDGLMVVYHRAPIVVPQSAWVRSCATHARLDNGTTSSKSGPR